MSKFAFAQLCPPMHSSVKILSILAIAVIMLAWPGLRLWRSIQIQRTYSSDPVPASSITANHVAALRKLRFAWNPLIESGGPVVDPWAPYGSENIADDLGPIIGTRDQVSIARFHREVSFILIEALRTCALPSGRYRLAHLDNAWMERRLRRDLAGFTNTRVEAIVAGLPRLSPDGHIDFTDQHRRLLGAIRLEWPSEGILPLLVSSGHPAPMVNFKRPFGDMTAFEIDMAAILDRPRAPAGTPDATLERLYWEMWPALQAFVEHAPIEKCTR